MRQLLQHVSRSFPYGLISSPRAIAGKQLWLPKTTTPFVCIQCRHRGSGSTPARPVREEHRIQVIFERTRRFSTFARVRQEDKPSKPAHSTSDTPVPRPDVTAELPKPEVSKSKPADGSTVKAVPDEDLPSHQERMRWKISKKFYQIMDDLMPKIALAGQKINSYTGTDYTGIEALRKEIIDQEKLVKSRVEAVQQAKDALEVARSRESSSRKEVVGLLERKHAWSDADLERYMNLIRSEHLNDQGIQAAKDNMAAAEMALEEARTRLEKRERMQYHEEQIWSDTIRRNSTWVTFGLMGLNIFLLLATLILIEPWRRRRLVREIKRTLEENQPALAAAPASVQAIDAKTEPKGVPLEAIEQDLPEPPLATSAPEALLAKEEQGTETKTPAREGQKAEPETPLLDLPEVIVTALSEPDSTNLEQSIPMHDSWSIEYIRNYFNDMFSHQRIILRKVDVTTIALEGAAAGAAIVGLLIVLFRPK
ncbi:hypothetical protein EJ08DRAFT_639919 [Tothia fuscella]|uniref:Sensitive to high expression protein 9, mitochondrial n=1 Tax=Tothia fuscella TaxID=1048955 RepID=A0A9P4NJ61_9PEZI|nr:hypothetical protein EJ08DRAFT_639919 [Tothia fuscella]